MKATVLALMFLTAIATNAFAIVQEAESTRPVADRAYREGRFKDAIRHYEKLVEAEPDDWQLAFRLAHSWHMTGNYRRSIEAHRKAAEFDRARAVSLYNIACAHSLLGEVDEGLDALGAALKAGFENLRLLKSDEDLTTLRSDPRFAKIVHAHENRATEPFTWDNLAERLRAEEEAGFSGSVLVMRDGKIVLSEGYGLANREKNIPCRPDTVYSMGSTPIDFTHVGILLLAQRGELSLSDPITKFFDEVPADKRGITIAHLMRGESGLEDFHDIPTDRDPDHSYIDRDEAMRRIFAKPLLFEPGQRQRHSHSAWGVLAAICEIVSGTTYQEFTQVEIYEPAGMRDTGFYGDEVAEERLAIGYGGKRDGEINAPPYWGPTSWLILGSGGQISTTLDLHRFQSALRAGKLLDPEWASLFFGPEDGRPLAPAGNAYGFEMCNTNGPDSKVIVMSNASWLGAGSAVKRIGRGIAELVNGTRASTSGSSRSKQSSSAPLRDAQWETVEDLLQSALAKSGVPAMAAAVTRNGELVASGVAGVRSIETSDLARIDDRFHWGSVGKSVTGTMLGRLIQEGVLSPDVTLAEAFPEFDLHAGYREVTLEHLMAHRGGLPPFTQLSGPAGPASDDATRIAQRTSFFAELLQQSPEGQPGWTQNYSNAGVALAAHIAERATGETWEQLVQQHVFAPNRLQTAGHGWPEDLGSDHPRGHRFDGERFRPATGMPTEHWRVLAPAGNVHGSILDLARYGIAHLDGLNGRDGYLESGTVAQIHTPLPGPGEPYAFGWGVATWPRGSDLECHWHNGSGGTYYALIKLVPELDLGVSFLANAYEGTEEIAEEILTLLAERFGDIEER